MMYWYWWLSFADGKKPRGQQWLGAIVTKAADFTEALHRTHRLGINPGGEVKGYQIDAKITVPPEFLDRLLSMEDVKNLDRANGGPGEAARMP